MVNGRGSGTVDAPATEHHGVVLTGRLEITLAGARHLQGALDRHPVRRQ